MGGIAHAVKKVFGGGSSRNITVSSPAPAAPAAETVNNQTNVETDAQKKKKKAAGKKSLMIGSEAGTSGGTTGTGLNL